MTFTIKTSPEKYGKLVANIIEDNIKEILKQKEHVVVGFPGGRSVSKIYKSLLESNIPWEKVHLFMVDERLVPIQHSESNFLLLKQELLMHLKDKIPEKNIHPFILDENAEDKGIADYERLFKSVGGKYDIILLSSGEDGHIAGLYPNHNSIKDNSYFYIIMDDSPKPPPERMSMSKNLMLKAKTAILLFMGESKKQAYRMYNNSSISLESCPCKVVQSIDSCYIITDLDKD